MRAVDLVSPGLERPVVSDEDLGDMSDGRVVGEPFSVTFDDDVEGRKGRAGRSDDAAVVGGQVSALPVPSPATTCIAPSIQMPITGMRWG